MKFFFFLIFIFFFFIDLRLSSPPYNMSICLTAIPVRCRRSQSPISKETPVYIREPQGKAEPTIRHITSLPSQRSWKL